MLRFRRPATAILVLLAFWPTLVFGQMTRAGVVTTLEGSVTATRVALPQPVPLRFKDDVFLNDRIIAGDRSFARMLLGDRAVVTVRERSIVTITEIPGRSTIDLESGKIALAAARDRMRAGERIEIRTPNAIAAVRGTVVIVEVVQASAQAGGPLPAVVTNFYVLRGSIEALHLDPVTKAPVSPPITVDPMQSFSVTGSQPPKVDDVQPGQVSQITSGLQPSKPQHAEGAGQQQVAQQQMQTATALLTALVGPAPGAEPPAGAPAESPAPDAVSATQPDTSAPAVGTPSSQVTTAPIVPHVSGPVPPETVDPPDADPIPVETVDPPDADPIPVEIVDPPDAVDPPDTGPVDVVDPPDTGPIPPVTVDPPDTDPIPVEVVDPPDTGGPPVIDPPPVTGDPPDIVVSGTRTLASGESLHTFSSDVTVGGSPAAIVFTGAMVDGYWSNNLLQTAPGVNVTSTTPFAAVSDSVVSGGNFLKLSSSLTTPGPLLELTDSMLSLDGAVVKLEDGSTLTVTSGPLVKITGGSLFAGALIATDGTPNVLNLTGTLLDLTDTSVWLGALLEEYPNLERTQATLVLGAGEPAIKLTGSTLTLTGSDEFLGFGTDAGPTPTIDGLALIATGTLGSPSVIALEGQLFDFGGATFTSADPLIQLTHTIVAQTETTKGLLEIGFGDQPVTMTGPLLEGEDVTLGASGPVVEIGSGLLASGTPEPFVLLDRGAVAAVGEFMRVSGVTATFSGPLARLQDTIVTTTGPSTPFLDIAGSKVTGTHTGPFLDLAATAPGGTRVKVTTAGEFVRIRGSEVASTLVWLSANTATWLPGDGGFNGQTGFLSAAKSVDLLAGPVTLSFMVKDMADTIMDSAVLLHNVTAGGFIVNGDFATGDLTGWSPAGAVSVVESLGDITPPNGPGRMAFLTTGAGAVDEMTSTLSQTFVLAAPATVEFAFAYNFLSDEYPDFIGTSFDDVFAAQVTQWQPSEVTLAGTLLRAHRAEVESGGNFLALSASDLTLHGSLIDATESALRSGDPATDPRSLIAVVGGAKLTGTSAEAALLKLVDSEIDASGSILTVRRSVEGRPSTVDLAGPLLSATGGALTASSTALLDAGENAVFCCNVLTVSEGAVFTGRTPDPLITLVGTHVTGLSRFASVSDTMSIFGELPIVAPSTLALGGPLLAADSSSITGLLDLLGIFRSSVTSATPEAFISLTDATVTFGGIDPFDTSTTTPGRLLNMWAPGPPHASLSLQGPLLHAENATIATTSDVFRIYNASVEGTTESPLISIAGETGVTAGGQFLHVVGANASVSLDGPLLDAAESAIETANNLVRIVDGGSVTSTTAAPLISLANAPFTGGVPGTTSGGSLLRLFSQTGRPGSSLHLEGPYVDAVGAVVATQDGSLFSIADGATVVSAGLEPFASFSGGSVTAAFGIVDIRTNTAFGDPATVGSGEPTSVSLAGPLLRAVDTPFTTPDGGLVLVGPGGELVVSDETKAPLVGLTGGTHAIASDSTAMFQLAGTATDYVTVDDVTLDIGTDRPVRYTGGDPAVGTLLETSGATITTRKALKVDTALLAASAPLLRLTASSHLTSAVDAMDLSFQAKVTSLGPVLALDASTLTVTSGAAIRVAGGSLLLVTGDLVTLAGGSTLNILDGPLLSVTGGSAVNVSDALLAFTGTGNTVNITNTLCGGGGPTCQLVSGVPVALLNDAVLSQVSISNPVLNLEDNALNVVGAVIAVDGPTSRVTVGQ
jgi:hypothetical protein